jgi:hypothetical protein
MARKKPSKTDQAKVAARRLIEDEEVQKQLRLAAVRARQAWTRASGRPASKAIGDKQVYAKVREAAVSLGTAGRRLRQSPEPPKRTGRNVVVGAALAGGTAYAVKRKRSGAPRHGVQPMETPPGPAPDAPLRTA